MQRLKLFLKHKLLVKSSINIDFVKQIVPTTNMPATATKLTYCRVAKALPLLRLQARRWGQYIINSSHRQNGKER